MRCLVCPEIHTGPSKEGAANRPQSEGALETSELDVSRQEQAKATGQQSERAVTATVLKVFFSYMQVSGQRSRKQTASQPWDEHGVACMQRVLVLVQVAHSTSPGPLSYAQSPTCLFIRALSRLISGQRLLTLHTGPEDAAHSIFGTACPSFPVRRCN